MTDRFDLAQAKLVFNRRDVEAMSHRLYEAALTVSSLPGSPRGPGSSWPATLREYGDVLGALQPGVTAEGRLETPMQTTLRVEAMQRRPRFAPTPAQIDACQPTLELLRGVGRSGLWRYEQRLAAARSEAAELGRRLAGLIDGTVPCATDRRAAVIARVSHENAAAQHRARRAQALFERAEADGRKTQRAVLGALKGAGTVWWLGAARVGMTKWDYAAAWSKAPSARAARELHDLGVYYALHRSHALDRRIG